MIQPSAEVIRPFVEAGWSANRCVPVPTFIPLSHPAHCLLSQFGGLVIGRCGPGLDCARSDLVFRAKAEDATDGEIANLQRLLNDRLASIADVHHGHGELFVDSRWRFFQRSCVHKAFWMAGESFNEAMERLLLGKLLTPIPLLDQKLTDIAHVGNSYKP